MKSPQWKLASTVGLLFGGSDIVVHPLVGHSEHLGLQAGVPFVGFPRLVMSVGAHRCQPGPSWACLVPAG